MSRCVICGAEFDARRNCVTCGSDACKFAHRSQVVTERWADRRNVKTCEICGMVFQSPPSDKTVTCSPGCREEKLRRLALATRPKNMKKCACCSREFADSPSNSRVTCRRRECTAWARSAHANPDYEAMRRGIAASPLLQPDERHVNAREWRLVAPDGTLYVFRNLRNFVRTHRELFDEDQLRVSGSRTDPIACLKLGHLRPGAKRPWKSWHGWRWDN